MARWIMAAAAASLFVSACGGGTPAVPPMADPATQRTLTQGDIVGFTDSDTGAQVWQGIAYAAAPQGDLRWRAPRRPERWDGVREMLAHPQMCPQITNALNAEATGVAPGQLAGSEDCLGLDVYAPPGAGPQSADRPVMVWIHGGANVWGSADQYDGAQLAADQNVVVVVIQYRLGPLGFFAHPAMAEGIERPADGAANFALLDMIAALHWVQDNAAQFGGDAGNVTIFGESAGGHNVAGLMASPLAGDLFHRAIIQSGSLASVDLEEARSGGEYAAVPAADRFAGPQADAGALQDAELQAIFDAYAGGMSGEGLPRMIADGVTVPRSGLAGAFDSTDTFNAVPVITGANRDEMKLFNIMDPDLTHRWFGAIIRVNDQRFFDILAHYQSRLWRALAVDGAAQAMTGAGHDAVWAYRFDWDEGGTMAFMDTSKLLGAAHAMEIPFIFNHFDFFGRLDPALFNDRNADGRIELAQSMGAYWASFARTGDPGAAGGPDWPAWRDGGVLMRFDSPADGGLEIITGTDSIEQIAAELGSDERLSQEERCDIRARLLAWGADEAALSEMGCASGP